MGPGDEIFPAAKWIRAQVGNLGGTISGAFLDVIPENAGLPAVRYHVQAPQDITVVSGTRVMTRILWLVVVVRQGLEVAPLVPIANALDAALHEQNGVADGYRIECVRQEPFNMMEPDDSGVQMRHAGGIYRTIVAPT